MKYEFEKIEFIYIYITLFIDFDTIFVTLRMQLKHNMNWHFPNPKMYNLSIPHCR